PLQGRGSEVGPVPAEADAQDLPGPAPRHGDHARRHHQRRSPEVHPWREDRRRAVMSKKKPAKPKAEEAQTAKRERELDEALEEPFRASDPVASTEPGPQS